MHRQVSQSTQAHVNENFISAWYFYQCNWSSHTLLLKISIISFHFSFNFTIFILHYSYNHRRPHHHHYHHHHSHRLFLWPKEKITSDHINSSAANLKRSITKSTSDGCSLWRAAYSYSYWFHTILCKFMDLHTLNPSSFSSSPPRSSTFSSTTLWWRTFWAGRQRCPPRSCTLTSTASSRPTPRAARRWRSSSGWANPLRSLPTRLSGGWRRH